MKNQLKVGIPFLIFLIFHVGSGRGEVLRLGVAATISQILGCASDWRSEARPGKSGKPCGKPFPDNDYHYQCCFKKGLRVHCLAKLSLTTTLQVGMWERRHAGDLVNMAVLAGSMFGRGLRERPVT